MITLTKIAVFITGTIFFVYDVVLRLFIVVCALFGIYVMVGLMVDWTAKLFSKPAPLRSRAA